MATSGLYNFNPDLIDIIEDAYERCDVAADMISARQMKSAMYSCNMVLADLSNKQLNLWTVEPGIIGLTPGRPTYELPQGTIGLLEVTIRNNFRPLDGTAASSAGGDADLAFDNDFDTSCLQTSSDGNISYDWGADITHTIDLVGYMSADDGELDLIFEGTYDMVTWVTAYDCEPTEYIAQQTQYFYVPNPRAFRGMRVRERGGATLDAAEVYFMYQVSDLLLSPMSRQEYTSIPNKLAVGRPLSFYFNRQINPTVTFWDTPNSQWQTIYYNRIRQVQDITAPQQTTDLPYRFLEAFTSSLAVKLAVKWGPHKLNDLIKLAELSVSAALTEDRERVPLRLTPDLTGY